MPSLIRGEEDVLSGPRSLAWPRGGRFGFRWGFPHGHPESVGFDDEAVEGAVEEELVVPVDELDMLDVPVELADAAEVASLDGTVGELFGVPEALEWVPTMLCVAVPVPVPVPVPVVDAVSELCPCPAECG